MRETPILASDDMEKGPSAMPGPGNCEARIITPMMESMNQSNPNRANNCANLFAIQTARY